jgi:hypothetical protein
MITRVTTQIVIEKIVLFLAVLRINEDVPPPRGN